MNDTYKLCESAIYLAGKAFGNSYDHITVVEDADVEANDQNVDLAHDLTKMIGEAGTATSVMKFATIYLEHSLEDQPDDERKENLMEALQLIDQNL